MHIDFADKSTSKSSNIQSGANVMFSIMLDVLYNGKSEEYQSIISSIKGGEKHEV